jgi:hypothetical protein
MQRTVTNCKNCKAGPEFVKVTSEPGTGAQVMFCGRCHHVISAKVGNLDQIPAPVEHLKTFAKSMTNLLMNLSGSEVMSHVFIEGLKSGVDMALSVPWSQKEHYWMEKYGVVKNDLIKELEDKLESLKELEKTASGSIDSNRKQKIEQIEDKLQQLKSES